MGADLPDFVFRCISRRRWKAGEPYGHLPNWKHWHRDYSGDPAARPPRCDNASCPEPKFYDAARWNHADQYALYASHELETAIEEKRKHLLDGRAAVGLPPLPGTAFSSPTVSKAVVTVEMPALTAPTYDGRDDGRDAFKPYLGWCDADGGRDYGAQLRDAGYHRIVVPSVPVNNAWGSVWFCLRPGQPSFAQLPDRSQVRVRDERTINSAGLRPC
jgi:hypothetical protein